MVTEVRRIEANSLFTDAFMRYAGKSGYTAQELVSLLRLSGYDPHCFMEVASHTSLQLCALILAELEQVSHHILYLPLQIRSRMLQVVEEVSEWEKEDLEEIINNCHRNFYYIGEDDDVPFGELMRSSPLLHSVPLQTVLTPTSTLWVL